MAGALGAISRGPILFVPGDMPWLETRALERLVDRAEKSDVDVAAPVWGSGETEHLVQWHRDGGTVRHLGGDGLPPVPGRRASEFLRAVPRTLLVPIGILSDRPTSFSHLTFARDFSGPSPRGKVGRSRRSTLVLGPPKRRYREGHAYRASRNLARAARAFAAEARWYSDAGFPILAWHALDDAIRSSEDAPSVRIARDRLRTTFPQRPSAPATVNRPARVRSHR